MAAFTTFLAGVLLLAAVEQSQAVSLPRQAQDPILDVGYARYRGSANPLLKLTTWNGIPYAAPPTGDLRWRAPVPIREHLPPTTNGSIYDATRTPKTCVQGNPSWPPPVAFPDTSREDCLYLNIVAPTQPKAKKLPIVAYIHGGAYITGNGEIPPFFASFMNGNAVFVSMQYRLGLFGFLGSSDVKADGTANAGLLDQRLALEWIKAHAESFGGDPNHIVLFGGSAGGSSVMSQLALRGGENDPPFHGALAEYPAWTPFHSQADLDIQQDIFQGAAGCDSLQCFRSVPEAQLINASYVAYQIGWEQGAYGYSDYWATPVVDGEIIKEPPTDAFRGGRFSKVPMLTTHSSAEGEALAPPYPRTEADVKTHMEQYWHIKNDTFFDQLLPLYPQSQNDDAYFAWVKPVTDALKLSYPDRFANVTGNRAWAQAGGILGDWTMNCNSLSAALGATNYGQPAWKMYFDAGSKMHGADAYFLLVPRMFSGNVQLETALQNWFASFIVHLDPNVNVEGVKYPRAANTTIWLEYGAKASTLKITDTTFSIITDTDKGPKCELFAANSELLSGRSQ